MRYVAYPVTPGQVLTLTTVVVPAYIIAPIITARWVTVIPVIGATIIRLILIIHEVVVENEVIVRGVQVDTTEVVL
jgi:hypothetical protein